MARVLEVLEDATWLLMGLENVVGVGRGHKVTAGQRTGGECVAVLVREKVPKAKLLAQEVVPQEVLGAPTDVIEVGELRFLGERTARMRPARPGVSIGHYAATAGTLGAVVWDRRTGEPLVLSNNHVLAHATSGLDGRARRGDPVLQPGSADGGRRDRDEIALLERFVPIRMGGKMPACLATRSAERAMNRWLQFTGTPARVEIMTRSLPPRSNIVDAAVARPIGPRAVEPDILELGSIRGFAEAEIGLVVKKSGRTTGVTQGEMRVTDATVTVVYSGDTTATFTDQLLTGQMAEGGDSGSLLLDESMRAVGLLFAGSDKSTIYNRIANVLGALDVSIMPPE